jgi:hypothetical protein
MSLFSRPQTPASELVITDASTWASLTEEQQYAYVSEIEKARLACRANRTFTVKGNQNFIIGAGVGGLITSLTPNHWSLNKRSTPFFALGLFGIIADWLVVTQKCQFEYPLPEGFSQITGKRRMPGAPDNPLMPSSTSNLSPYAPENQRYDQSFNQSSEKK